MNEVKRLKTLNAAMLDEVISGYTSAGKYVVNYEESAVQTTFSLHYTLLPAPVTRRYDHHQRPQTLQHYQAVLAYEYSFAAYDDKQPVALLIAEPRAWNRSVWVWEFHVREQYRRQGLGRQLMERLVSRSVADGMRTIVCETQNNNAMAITAYRRLGFRIEGVDISYYSNVDYPDGDIAVFLKKRLR